MSTTVDLRAASDLPRGTARNVAPVGRPAGAGPKRPAPRRASRRAQAAGQSPTLAQPKIAGRARQATIARQRLAFQPGRAGFVALVTVFLSLLGMIYLTQISHVARYGYLLSALQDQQAKLDRENELLEYRINGERTLAHASDIASHDYRMQSFTNAPKVNTQTGVAIAPSAGELAAARSAPQIRFVTVQRPAARPPAPVAKLPLPTLVDRLWNRIVGIGAARSGE